jgi:hypothetical protein
MAPGFGAYTSLSEPGAGSIVVSAATLGAALGESGGVGEAVGARLLASVPQATRVTATRAAAARCQREAAGELTARCPR